MSARVKLGERVSGGLALSDALVRIGSFSRMRAVVIGLGELARLLWAAQGVTKRDSGWIYPLRSAPSAGGLYPLEVYVALASGAVEGLDAGLYHYDPVGEEVVMLDAGEGYYEYLNTLVGASSRERLIHMLVCAVYPRTTGKYGQRGVMYVHNEIGHVLLNVMVECASLNLGCKAMIVSGRGRVKETLKLSEEPLLDITIGKPI